MPPLSAPKLPAPRLPPLKRFRVQQPNRKPENPCIGIMSSMLGCWASSGYSVHGCTEFEMALRGCMDSKRPPPPPPNFINRHLSRFYPQMVGPRRRPK